MIHVFSATTGKKPANRPNSLSHQRPSESETFLLYFFGKGCSNLPELGDRCMILRRYVLSGKGVKCSICPKGKIVRTVYVESYTDPPIWADLNAFFRPSRFCASLKSMIIIIRTIAAFTERTNLWQRSNDILSFLFQWLLRSISLFRQTLCGAVLELFWITDARRRVIVSNDSFRLRRRRRKACRLMYWS